MTRAGDIISGGAGQVIMSSAPSMMMVSLKIDTTVMGETKGLCRGWNPAV